MNKNQLKELIKGIIRENLETREYNQLLKEVSPPGKKAEKMIHHVKTSLRKSHPDWSEDKITSVAIATGWKAHNKENVEEAGLTSEAAYKVMADHSYTDAEENKALTVQTDPNINESGESIPKGALAGYVKKQNPDKTKGVVKSIPKVPSPKKLKEASFKVIAQQAATTVKEDKAKRIQTEPKVNETSYKTQGPSLKTFDQSPQFPDAVNDPTNA